nr:hypothetical protein [Tanacetum cinerariifolium]
MMAVSVEELLDQIMDSGGSYHITYMRDYLVDFQDIAGGLDHINHVIRLPIEHGISRAPGVVKPEIMSNVNFEIKSQFMREFRKDNVSENKNEDAYDHIDRVLNIVDEVKYGEFGHPALFNRINGAKFCAGPPGYYTHTDNQTPSGDKRPNLVEIINKYMEGAAKRQVEHDKWLKTFCQNTEKSRIDHDKIIQKLKSQVKTLTTEVETKVAN